MEGNKDTMITRKNYVALADIFNHHSNKAYPSASALMAALLEDLTQYMEEDNSSFDRDKFLNVVYSSVPPLTSDIEIKIHREVTNG
jgi:hypothetical protein